MRLNQVEQEMLAGHQGPAVKKAMQILHALGQIYGAEDMVPVTSVQVAGVSYDNLGEAGLDFLSEMAAGGGKAQVLTTLNPAGMDLENWQNLGIHPDFARQQIRVIQAFEQMDILSSCTCTPYLSGNSPHFAEHIAWSESSAVCYANSVIGARTNREGGPGALAASITGRTPRYGFHLKENRAPKILARLDFHPSGTLEFGALGKVLGDWLDHTPAKPLLYIQGIQNASVEELKSFCASIATFGGAAMFHMENITPEYQSYPIPPERITVQRESLDQAVRELNNASVEEIDFISLGCPHLSISELRFLAHKLDGTRVTKTFWITTSRTNKKMADQMGYTKIIENAGGIFAVDTCCVVAPIRGRFTALATDSAKACYYAAGKNRFKTRFLTFDEVIEMALQ